MLGIWLFANGWFVVGSVTFVLPKNPVWSAGLIAKELNSVSVRIRVSSKLTKPKVLSFLIGPPALPPNWCLLNFGRCRANVFRASKKSFRTNSKSVP